MSIRTNQPITRDGNIYDHLAANLALSTMWHADRMGVSIAVRLTPYRVGADGLERLDDSVQAVVFGDAVEAAQTDAALAQFLQSLEAAAQAFIDAKGL